MQNQEGTECPGEAVLAAGDIRARDMIAFHRTHTSQGASPPTTSTSSHANDSSEMPLVLLRSATKYPPWSPGRLTGAFGALRPLEGRLRYPQHIEYWMQKMHDRPAEMLRRPRVLGPSASKFLGSIPPHRVLGVPPGPYYRSERGKEAMRAALPEVKRKELRKFHPYAHSHLMDTYAVPPCPIIAAESSSSTTIESVNDTTETNFPTKEQADTTQTAPVAPTLQRTTAPPGVPRKKKKRGFDRRRDLRRWPPAGFLAQWHETEERVWQNTPLPGPDELAPEHVWDEIERLFKEEIKRERRCKWGGCGKSQKNLRRHVESVHLRLRLLCAVCGHPGRSDHRTNSGRMVHEHDCPLSQKHSRVD